MKLQEDIAHYHVGRHLDHLSEEDRRLSIGEVTSAPVADRFRPCTTEVPNLGFSDRAHWFRLELRSGLRGRQELFLEIPHPVLDRIEFYAERDDGGFDQRTVGEAFAHGNKVIKHYNFVLPIQIDHNQRKRFYFRVSTSGSLQLPLELWTVKGFLANEHEMQLFFGLLFGFLIVMIFYNLFVYLAVRDRSYVLYGFCICFLALWEGSIYGLAQEYLWPALPWLAEKAYCLSGLGFALFAILFLKQFLDLPRTLAGWNRVANVFALLIFIGIVTTPLLPYRVVVLFLAVHGIVTATFCLICAIVSWRRGFKAARYYFAAWTALLVGLLFFAFNKFGIVPRNMFTENAHLIGAALNAILLSLALADRINVLRQEKEQAQGQALEVQRQAAENLEKEVQKRTQELKEAYESLAEHDRLKSRFFANVSHEVRTPLTLILTPLERMLSGESGQVSEQAKEKLRSMVGNVQRLLRLVNQLLDFSRLESGGTTVSFERMDIGPMVETIVNAFEPFAQSKGLRLTMTRPGILPEVVVDPAKLEKVVSNLLSNACKFTEPGDKAIVGLSCDASSLTISIKDTGIGIAPQDLPRIFERFHQVDGSASRRHEGTGIGLALSKELVDLMGGKLEVSSELDVGSTFTVTLPLGTEHIKDASLLPDEADGDRHDHAVAAAGKEASAALTAETGLRPDADQEQDARKSAPEADDTRPTIVVVEDNPDMRELLAEICQEEFRVQVATDGQQGLELVQQLRPALVISDIMMPVMDGYEMLGRIRSTPSISSTPVILLTAKAGPEMMIEGLETGANDYLAKPFESRELLARARNLVRMDLQQKELFELSERLQEEVVAQATELERARMLGRYLPPTLARSILEEGEPVQVGQERRQLTVFLMELKGFDGLVEQLAPEDMAAMLNGYLSEMMELAMDHGATVDRLIQDTVGGFFGAPTSQGPEQDALQCARMAGQMWKRAVEISQGWVGRQVRRPPVPTLVLASGFATVGNFGSSKRLEYSAVGGPVSEAHAILSAVEPGMVACSQSTWALVKDQHDGELYGTVESPHWSEPRDLYRLDMPALATSETLDSDYASPWSPGGTDPLTRDPSTRASVASIKKRRPAHRVKELAPGTVLAGRYAVLKKLGRGGMGVVYQVQDLKLETEIALKLLLRDFQDDPQGRRRLYREAKLARFVGHPNVARIYDIGEWEGHEFISMEYIQGRSLGQHLRRGDLFDIDRGLDVFRQICAGLAAAHLAGVIHRDLKPSNIMLEEGGRTVIMDFGIARWSPSSPQTDTGTGGTAGTPLYMSPEQFAGGDVDHRADIYALGCVAFEIFTSKRPFSADHDAGLGYQHTHHPPPHPRKLNPELPPRLAAVILRCLRKRPAERFGRAEEITALLASVQPHRGEEPHRSPRQAKPPQDDL